MRFWREPTPHLWKFFTQIIVQDVWQEKCICVIDEQERVILAMPVVTELVHLTPLFLVSVGWRCRMRVASGGWFVMISGTIWLQTSSVLVLVITSRLHVNNKFLFGRNLPVSKVGRQGSSLFSDQLAYFLSNCSPKKCSTVVKNHLHKQNKCSPSTRQTFGCSQLKTSNSFN